MVWDSTVNVILVSLLVRKMWYDINQRLKDLNQMFKDHNRIMEKTGVLDQTFLTFWTQFDLGTQWWTTMDLATHNMWQMMILLVAIARWWWRWRHPKPVTSTFMLLKGPSQHVVWSQDEIPHLQIVRQSSPLSYTSTKMKQICIWQGFSVLIVFLCLLVVMIVLLAVMFVLLINISHTSRQSTLITTSLAGFSSVGILLVKQVQWPLESNVIRNTKNRITINSYYNLDL